jgi:hypothetical protein
MKIAVISFGTSDYEIGNYTKKINKEYCIYNNYNFSYYDKIPSNMKNRHPAWCKIYYLVEKMKDKKYDYIMWIDGDAFFCNKNIKIEKWIKNNSDIIISRDPGYTIDDYNKNKNLLNSGVMIFKNTNENEILLNKLLHDPLYIPNYNFKRNFNPQINMTGWDQAAIRHCYKSDNYMNKNTTVILDTNFNNNTNDINNYINNGGYIIHLTNFMGKFDNKKLNTIYKFNKLNCKTIEGFENIRNSSIFYIILFFFILIIIYKFKKSIFK